MGVAEQIIARIDRGEEPQQVANQVSWVSIRTPERQKLFHEAERRSSKAEQPDALLWALYRMANRANDEWDSLRALALIIRRPDLEMGRKQKGLEVVWRQLDGLRANIDQRDQRSIQRYKLYEADYHALRGQVVQEEGSENWLPVAIQCYSHARDIWERYGEADHVAWARQQIEVLQGILERKETLLPLDLLRSERSTLQAEIEDLRRQEQKLQEALADTQQSEQEASARNAKLASEVQAAEAELKQLQDDIVPSQKSLLELQSRIHEHEAALHFLTALPRIAAAPLWIEVVRIALEQGDIDSLTQQAIERLVLVCPEEALPLLAEVAARAPEPFQYTPEQFKDAAAGWMAGIAEARTLKEKDARGAAQRLVDSWAAFFDGVSEGDSDA